LKIIISQGQDARIAHRTDRTRATAATLRLITLAAGLLLAACSGGGGGSNSAGTPLTISTSALPAGQVGVQYSTTLSATGGTPPVSWAQTGGALPAGLSLAAATGVISGTPTAPVSNSSITFQVTDSGSPAQSKSATLGLTI
jgi:hypothetical protein